MAICAGYPKGEQLNCPVGIAVLLGILSAALVGCRNEGLIDLKQYVQRIKSRPQGIINPPSIIKVKPYKTFTYQASGLRDPFMPTVVEHPPESITRTDFKLKDAIMPDLNRYKEALEEYPLDSLRMVGTLRQGVDIWAVVRASDGILYRVKEGNHMGQNYGKITAINEEMIKLTEIISDEGGSWLKRQVTLALAE